MAGQGWVGLGWVGYWVEYIYIYDRITQKLEYTKDRRHKEGREGGRLGRVVGR